PGRLRPDGERAQGPDDRRGRPHDRRGRGGAVRPIGDAGAGLVVTWAELPGRSLAVEVPASSANLGAGYDCLGLALELTNRVILEACEGDGSIELAVTGEGAG